MGLGRLAAAMVAGQALGIAALLVVPRPVGVTVSVLLFGAGFGALTIARAALLGSDVPQGVFASVSGGQSLAANAGRVVAPAATGTLISAAGYGVAFTAVAVCSLGASAVLVGAERVHAVHGGGGEARCVQLGRGPLPIPGALRREHQGRTGGGRR